MPPIDPEARALLAGADRFMQWDLVTVTPWGAPSISPVGARLVAEEATVWTSTTVSYAAKVRNIRSRPRVALLRAAPGEPALLVRGEARVVAGDGTLNLAQLFRLMDGAGGARPFFSTSATDPLWSRLYRSYWRRFLIAVRIVDISRLGRGGWEPHRVARWSAPRRSVGGGSSRRRPSVTAAYLDQKGRRMLAAATPAVLATVRRVGAAPLAWPVAAAPLASGAISVSAPFPLPGEQLPKSSLAVRVVDDTFEVAKLTGWIGTLERGRGSRRFLSRSVYGFAKPPGIAGDLAAGLAALVRAGAPSSEPTVSVPDLPRAIRLGGAGSAEPLQLSEAGWRLLEQFFARRNADAVWYSGAASLTSDRRQLGWLAQLAERAQLERDWAHGLLIQGERKMGAGRLAAGLLALRPLARSGAEAVGREEEAVERLRQRLRSELPSSLAGPLGLGERSPSARPRGGARISRRGALLDATVAAASSAAAAVDRLKTGARR